jgi:uncharacterized protein (TIGR03067 family)
MLIRPGQSCLAVLLVVLGLALPARAVRDPAEISIQAELHRLEGNWVAVKIIFDGEDMTALMPPNYMISVRGDKLTSFSSDKAIETSSLKLDPYQSPRAIDYVTENGKKRVGIYERTAATLTICINMDTSTRPTSLTSARKSKNMLLVLKRK